MSTLANIRAKVRRVTGRASENQLSNTDLDGYINDFLVYELPSHTRLMYNRQTYSFQLTPNVAVYSINAFKNDYMTFEPPAYVDGFEMQYMQSEQSFYQMYPRLKYSVTLTAGNNTTGPYTGTYSYTPIVPETVVISTLDINGNSQVAVDNGLGVLITGKLAITGITQAVAAVVTIPGVAVNIGDLVYIDGVQGMTQINGGAYVVTGVVGNEVTINVNSTLFSAYTFGGNFSIQSGTINYTTGAVAALTWLAIIPTGEIIYISANDYVVGRPYAVLYFNNEFRFWPFPDRAYTFEIVTYKNPAQLLAVGQAPELNLWGDVIAYGASQKIFADNLDMESYGKVQILFDEHKRLAERRTLKQLSNQRVSTIYDDGMSYPTGYFGYPYG